MSFRPYASYQETHVEGLDLLPDHWLIGRLGYEGWVRARLGWKGLKADEYIDDGFILLSTPNIKGNFIDFINVNYISRTRYEESPEIILKSGDVLLAKDGSTLGTVNVLRELVMPATVNSSIAVITPGPRLNSIYLYYYLRTRYIVNLIESVKDGMGVPHLFQDDIKRFRVPLPPLAEQAAIAVFLDSETAKIDVLVEEQRRLVVLLKEKRQAAISHAVTKGLNQDAPMKDSGIEWLGKVPEHWGVKPLKFLARVGNGSTPNREIPDFWRDGNVAWLNSSVVNQEIVIKAEQFVTQLAIQRCHLPIIEPPALLMAITGQGKTRGMVALLGCTATISQHIAYIKNNDAIINVRFIRSWFDAAYSIIRSQSEGAGSTKGAITCNQIEGFPVAVPPLSEQEQINTYIASITKNFELLTKEAETAIRLLQERRAAVISAAVTGKIDVRSFAIPTDRLVA